MGWNRDFSLLLTDKRLETKLMAQIGGMSDRLGLNVAPCRCPKDIPTFLSDGYGRVIKMLDMICFCLFKGIVYGFYHGKSPLNHQLGNI